MKYSNIELKEMCIRIKKSYIGNDLRFTTFMHTLQIKSGKSLEFIKRFIDGYHPR